MLAEALQAEVGDYIARHVNERDGNGRRLVEDLVVLVEQQPVVRLKGASARLRERQLVDAAGCRPGTGARDTHLVARPRRQAAVGAKGARQSGVAR